MKILPALLVALCVFSLLSCQKSFLNPVATNGVDSTVTPSNSNLVYKAVVIWSEPSNPDYDSSITLYTYDAKNFLIKSVSIFPSPDTVYYPRDANERITDGEYIVRAGDTVYTHIQYTDDVSSKILYVLNGKKSLPQPTDSTAYTYTGSYVSKISFYSASAGAMALQQYETVAVDEKGNVIQIQIFNADNTLNIGYSFEYDNYPNPFYSKDDVRLSTDWGYTLSPNNITKQVNHYPQMPEDYVAYTCQYNSMGQVTSSLRYGSAIGKATVQSFFYYK